MSRISLICPNDKLVYKFARNNTKRFPLGIAYVASALERAGHDVKITDASLNDFTAQETVGRALANDPQFAGIGCTTPLYNEAAKIIDLIKEQSPSTVVLFGGPHVSALPEATLKTSQADIICIGEAEENSVSVIDSILQHKDLNNIPSIAFRYNGSMGHTAEYRLRLHQPPASTIPAINLNTCPIPARHLFECARYRDDARGACEPQTGAMFSRGCPGKCAFCGAANTLVRWRNLDNVFEELELIQAMGIKHVFVMDDTYTNNRKRILDLSKGIVDRGIHLSISVQLRLDQIDEEICEAMYASGVRYVGPGIESGNEQIMKAIGKGPKESRKHMLGKVRLLQKYDWIIRCSFVMGMVGETEEQIMETIEFAKELGATENAFSILVPYPDSPLWKLAKATGQVDDYMDFRKFIYYHEIGCNLSAVPTERLLELHELAYQTVVSRYQTEQPDFNA